MAETVTDLAGSLAAQEPFINRELSWRLRLYAVSGESNLTNCPSTDQGRQSWQRSRRLRRSVFTFPTHERGAAGRFLADERVYLPTPFQEFGQK